LQLSALRVEPRFDALKESVIAIASALEEKQAVPSQVVDDQVYEVVLAAAKLMFCDEAVESVLGGVVEAHE
jgi:hypothetical protein